MEMLLGCPSASKGAPRARFGFEVLTFTPETHAEFLQCLVEERVLGYCTEWLQLLNNMPMAKETEPESEEEKKAQLAEVLQSSGRYVHPPPHPPSNGTFEGRRTVNRGHRTSVPASQKGAYFTPNRP